MKLFEDKNRIYDKPATHNSNTYNYYDCSSRVDIAIIRKVLNEWFDDYPDTEKNELNRRFNKSFTSAFYELFIFNLFKLQGFKIEIHPDIPGTTKKPDFLISKGDIEFYLEAKVAMGESEKQVSLKRRINQIYDSLNNIKSARIEELIIKTKIQPSIKQFRDKIETELKNFDPDTVTKDIQAYGLEGCPKIAIEDKNLQLIISLIPKDPQYRKENDNAIGVYPSEVFWGGEEESIKTSFSKKAKRYGRLDKPYIVCINSIGRKFTGNYDVMNAIWGTLAISWSTNPNDIDEKIIRMNDGLFISDKGPEYKNVSGVLITHVMEFNIPNSSYRLVKHPFADKELDFKIIDMSYQYLRDGKIITTEGKTIAEIFNIKTDWLDE